MLSVSIAITDVIVKEPFSLIFGNEAAGLPDEELSVVIKHTDKIDSLNLPMAVGIAVYESTKKLGCVF